MKVLHESCMEHADSAALDGLRKEAEKLQSLHHPNIINVCGACFEGKQARDPLLRRIALCWEADAHIPVLAITKSDCPVRWNAQMMVVSEVCSPVLYVFIVLATARNSYQ